MKINSKKTQTIFRRVLFPLMIVVFLQLMLFVFALNYVGVFEVIRSNATDFFQERTENRKNYLVSEMQNRWSNISEEQAGVANTIDLVLEENGKTVEEIKTDWKLNEKIIESITPQIIEMLRLKGTTGAFCILNGEGSAGNKNSYASVYLRDSDPSSSLKNNSDILLLRGLPSLSRNQHISLSSFWEASFNFENPDDKASHFFFAPLNSAIEENATVSQYHSYWSTNFKLGENSDEEIITYSMPIIAKDGTIYGVIGVEITTEFLAQKLNYDEIAPDKRGVYILGKKDPSSDKYQVVCLSGPAYSTYFGSDKLLSTKKTTYSDLDYIFSETKEGMNYVASVNPLQLYNRNTPFENQEWAFISLMPESIFLNFFSEFRLMLIICAIAAVALGLIVAFFASRGITVPISRLVTDLKNSNPFKAIELKRLNIEEIDDLSYSIEMLSNSVAESSSRMSKIISMSKISIGVFEIQSDSELVYCSESIFDMLEWSGKSDASPYYSKSEIVEKIENLKNSVYDNEQRIFKFGDGKNTRWVQLNVQTDSELVLGVAVDVTDDVKEKQKIEYERDYDTLTNTINRRAFQRILDELFVENTKQLKVSALLMLDLDNLKYLNDKYGHDCGDRYIQTFSEGIKRFEKYGAVVARRSGDEFYILFYGFDNKQDIRDIIFNAWKDICETGIILPDLDMYRVRASGGIAWYPDDADNQTNLVRYADFAMYSVKHSIKGSIAEFDALSYNSDAILLNGAELLNQLIEEEQVRYAFQPVIDTNGEIYGYEMLMRPQMNEFSSPLDVLRIAKVQSKMHLIEKLTWTVALKTFDETVKTGAIAPNVRVFVNSSASQVLPKEIRKELETKYPDLLNRVVLEITESEQQVVANLTEKYDMIKEWGALIALDDYGTGYNSEMSLISSSANIVKLDISLVRGVDVDKNRQNLISGIISYAKSRDILVLAEGVETELEFKILLDIGVDLVQGFFVARPSFDIAPINQSVMRIIDEFKAN